MRCSPIALVALSTLFAAGPLSAASAAPTAPAGLRCEGLLDPLGIDADPPRLSWELRGPERGLQQTAYRVMVASSRDRLDAGEGDLWDSGRVESAQSVHVPYAGAPLGSHAEAWWKVRVWTDSAAGPGASPWSAPARWTMGILDEADWQARWIGYAEPDPEPLRLHPAEAELTFEGCQWVWTPEGDPRVEAPAGRRHFRKLVTWPEDDPLEWAYLLMAADDWFRVEVNGERASEAPDQPEVWRRAYEVELTERLRLKGSPCALTIQVENRASGPAGLCGKLIMATRGGRHIIVPIDETWQATADPGTEWRGPRYAGTSHTQARAVAPVGAEPWGMPARTYAVGWSQEAPSPRLRTAFRVDKPVRRAMLYVAGVGYHEAWLNGGKVGDEVLAPAFTDYEDRVVYVTHDVTGAVAQGPNALGLQLANGWYNMHTRAEWDFDGAPWRGLPRARALLRVEHPDGTVTTVGSGDDWRAAEGPLRADGIRAGQVYDARMEQPGWSTAGYDDSGWAQAEAMAAPDGVPAAQMMPPMRVTQSLQPVSVDEPVPGVFVFDFGQNMAGWARLAVEGPAGRVVHMRYAESIQPDGQLYRQDVLRFIYEGPIQDDTYILKGEGREVFEPRFAYHGFRYVEVTGYPGRPTLADIEARVVHTDFDRAGAFTCSEPLLNDIHRLALWSYRGNYHGYPTDCPHREKNGWMGDAHLAAEMGLYDFDSASAYRKWVQDIVDAQRPSGEVPGIVPTGGWGFEWGNGPAWDSALTLVPWYVYQYEGDPSSLVAHYDAMKRYVDYVETRSDGLIADFGLGDHLPAATETPRAVTSTGYFYGCARIVADTAALMGRDDDARRYGALAADIRRAFNDRFYQGDGIYANGSQTALSCALHWNLVPDGERDAVVRALVAAVEAAGGHFDGGILGAKYIFRALSDHGHHELAYRIATQRDFPSYGYWLEQGATTMWEWWQGGRGSFNHIMFGDIVAWFYTYLAGIQVDPAAPGFKHIVIRPRPAEGLDWVRASTHTPYGAVRVAWRRDGDAAFAMDLTVPANTTATVHLPAGEDARITESGRPLDQVQGVEPAGYEGGGWTLEVGAGSYRFMAG